jgi:hypothetical protein
MITIFGDCRPFSAKIFGAFSFFAKAYFFKIIASVPEIDSTKPHLGGHFLTKFSSQNFVLMALRVLFNTEFPNDKIFLMSARKDLRLGYGNCSLLQKPVVTSDI